MVYQLVTGAYTGGQPGEGVVLWQFDCEKLEKRKGFQELRNPSYVLPWKDHVFAVEELSNEAGMACLSLQKGEELQCRWKKTVPGAGLCHLTCHNDVVYAAGYDGGSLTAVQALSGDLVFSRLFEGGSVNPLRQEKAHIHSTGMVPDGSRLLAADLGTDRIYQFTIEKDGALTEDPLFPWVTVKPGHGPRHFVFHPNGKWLYLVAELERMLWVFHWDGQKLEERAVYPLREADDPESSLAADVHITADGKFLYVSVRGPDCLYCFKTEEEGGKLHFLERVPSGGNCPRNFSISPDEAYLAVANQDSGNLVIFSRDRESGTVKEKIWEENVPQVSCVKWINPSSKENKEEKIGAC